MAPTAANILRDSIEKARSSPAFRHYEHVRDLVLGMMDEAAGGFAHQLKTLFPNITYTIVDLPQTLLFSATYLKATFPDARVRIYGEVPAESLFDDLDHTDILFLPAHAFGRLAIPPADLAVNLASFQAMTTEHVRRDVNKLADSGAGRCTA